MWREAGSSGARSRLQSLNLAILGMEIALLGLNGEAAVLAESGPSR
jgi:hypothetical protein